ncbi:hypothetical protein [Wukongibacter sp. M2B1]|uniref:hypothetical protein n=1 Tax=Wukongibacter sp. M2B1 TaxID=3088895 RepID=UPI003D7A5A93
MLVDKERFKKEIFLQKFNGNYYQCAKALKVSSPQLHRFINKNHQAGAKLLGGIYEFCQNERLSFRNFVILPSETKN